MPKDTDEYEEGGAEGAYRDAEFDDPDTEDEDDDFGDEKDEDEDEDDE